MAKEKKMDKGKPIATDTLTGLQKIFTHIIQWNDLLKSKPVELDIPRPPCEHCVHWSPEVEFTNTDSGQMATGIRMCWEDDQLHDFSCFSKRIK